MANLWTLAQVCHRSVRKHPGHTMVVAGGNKQSYAQVDARSSSLAAAMAEPGLGAGDRVAIILPNRSEWIVARLACAKLRAAIVPVNPRLNYHELKYQLRHAEVSAALTAEAVRRHRLPFVLRGRHGRASGPAASGHGRRRGAVVRRPDLRVRGSSLEWGRVPVFGPVVG